MTGGRSAVVAACGAGGRGSALQPFAATGGGPLAKNMKAELFAREAFLVLLPLALGRTAAGGGGGRG